MHNEAKLLAIKTGIMSQKHRILSRKADCLWTPFCAYIYFLTTKGILTDKKIAKARNFLTYRFNIPTKIMPSSKTGQQNAKNNFYLVWFKY